MDAGSKKRCRRHTAFAPVRRNALRLLRPTGLLRETALIEQSKEDFKAGRTYTVTEARAYVSGTLARRRALRTKA